jgi:competence ComEA-like helix-hairpin-helix protein
MMNRSLLYLLAMTASATAALAAGELPDGAGKQIIQQHCAGCHAGNALAGYQKTREDWDAIVVRMGQRTAASRDDLTTLADYLAANFPKIDDPTKVNMNKADAKEISERLGLSMTEAEAIIKYRDRRGNFRTWGDLLVIYGVDGTKIEALQDKMSF